MLHRIFFLGLLLTSLGMIALWAHLRLDNPHAISSVNDLQSRRPASLEIEAIPTEP